MFTVMCMSSGSALHRVGPAQENERRPYRSRLCRGTVGSSLYSTRHFTGSQWSCFNAAIMLCQSPCLIRSTTLAAGPCQVDATGGQISRTRLRSRSQYATSRGNGRGFCRLPCSSICVSWQYETGENRRLGRRSTPEPTCRVHCQE